MLSSHYHLTSVETENNRVTVALFERRKGLVIRVLNGSKHFSSQQVVKVDCLRVPYLCENGSNCAADVKVKSLCFLILASV